MLGRWQTYKLPTEQILWQIHRMWQMAAEEMWPAGNSSLCASVQYQSHEQDIYYFNARLMMSVFVIQSPNLTQEQERVLTHDSTCRCVIHWPTTPQWVRSSRCNVGHRQDKNEHFVSQSATCPLGICSTWQYVIHNEAIRMFWVIF